MKRLLVFLLLASPCFASHDYSGAYLRPNVPVAREVEIADPQVNTFCASNLSCTVSAAWVFSSSLTVSGTATTKQLNNSYNATQFSGSDIYAQVNTAMATACPQGSNSLNGPGGTIVIPPGTYSVSTTLTSNTSSSLYQYNGCTVTAYGTIINFTGTGPAILIKNTSNFKYMGGHIFGPGSGGTVRGIQLGDRTSLLGSTYNNHIEDVTVDTFGICFFGDGTTGGGTYFNHMENFNCGQFGGNGNGKGIVLNPATVAFFNNNFFYNSSAHYSTTDGIVIDGAYDIKFDGDSENNSGCGIRLGDTLSTAYLTLNVHTESNTTADYCSATTSNLAYNKVFGPAVSTTTCSVACNTFWNAGTRNWFLPGGKQWVQNWPAGSVFQGTVDSASPVANIWQIFNNESPPSGNTNILGITRSGADAGTVGAGTPEYPASVVGNIVPRSAATGSDTVGTALLPYSGVFIGSNVNNSVKLAATVTGNRTATFPDANIAKVADTATLTLKSGSGAGSYTGTNTTLAAVDTTNLCTTITVPTGWKLMVSASGVGQVNTAAVGISVALADAGATCTSGGVTGLNGSQRDFVPPAVATNDQPWHTQYILTGDGAAHSIALMARTSNAADAWVIINSSAISAPSVTYTLMPSN